MDSTLDLSDNIVLDELDYDANFDSNYCTFQDFLFLTFQGSKLRLNSKSRGARFIMVEWEPKLWKFPDF